jgi:hypothetical protein
MLCNPDYREARIATEDLLKQSNRESMKKLRQEEKAKMFGDDPEDLVCR